MSQRKISHDCHFRAVLRVEVMYAGWTSWQLFATPETVEEGLGIINAMTAMKPSMELPGEFRLVRTETTVWTVP
jgi:hypothetical protein